MGEVADIVTGAPLGQAPICSLAISPERLMAQLSALYSAWEEKRVPGPEDRIPSINTTSVGA